MKNKQRNLNSSVEEINWADFRDVLFLFDIDGTMTDSKAMDDHCFIESLQELYDFDLADIEWSDFENVTDAGLADEIYRKYKGRAISKTGIKKIQRTFFNKISKAIAAQPESSKPIVGIHEFLEVLTRHQISMAIATGGWRKSAEQKLAAANISYNDFTLATSNDSPKRRTIINVAIARAQFEYQKKFSAIIYFGDGSWDAATCNAMSIPMIGIDYHIKGHLQDHGIKYVFKDYKNHQAIFNAATHLLLAHVE